MLKNPDGTFSLSRCGFAAALLIVLVKVMLNGVVIGGLECGSIDAGLVAAMLGTSGLAYASRTHQQGVNNDPKGAANVPD